MNEELFRKKSLNKIKSPENLDDYIRVANPGIWILLFSVVVLLAGACVWGIFGQIVSSVDTSVHVENGNAVCYVSEEHAASVEAGMSVKFDDFEATIDTVKTDTGRGIVCVLTSKQEIPNGIYDGAVVTGTIHPISFVWN